MTTISIIVAHNLNRVIGVDGQLPWSIPEDLQYFKENTLGKPVIMGRKTYESIGKPLPDRKNIVLTTNKEFTAEGVTIVYTKEDALKEAGDVEEVMIMGGGAIYEMFFPEANRLYVTIVDQPQVKDGVKFVEYDRTEWKVCKYEPHYADEGYSCNLAYIVADKVMV